MGKLGRTIQVGLLVGAALALTMAPVLAATVSGSLSGFEDAVPTCTGSGSTLSCTASFAGYFSASKYRDSGFWNATVEHGPLPETSGNTGSTGTITGGLFALDMLSGKVVTGSGMTGTITYDAPSYSWFGCTQTYALTIGFGSVSGTSAFSTASVSDATLTHYGTSITTTDGHSSCNGIYFATVTGILTLGS